MKHIKPSRAYQDVPKWPNRLNLPDDAFTLIKGRKNKSLVKQLIQYGVSGVEIRNIIELRYNPALTFIEIFRSQKVPQQDKQIKTHYRTAVDALREIIHLAYISERKRNTVRREVNKLISQAEKISTLALSELAGKMNTPKSITDMLAMTVYDLMTYIKDSINDNPDTYGDVITDKDIYKLIAEILTASYTPARKWDEKFMKELDDNFIRKG
jgi:hypothetical protein